MTKKRREWSRQFTPRTNNKPINLSITNVPPTLLAKFRAKCRRVDKSQRNLILSWVQNWVEDRRPDEDRPSREPGALTEAQDAPQDFVVAN